MLVSTTISEQSLPATPAVVRTALAWSDGWRQVARFLEDHPEIANGATITGYVDGRALCYLSEGNPVRLIESAARACVAAGGRVEAHKSELDGGVRLWFGPAHIYVYAPIDLVFATRVTGMVEQREYTLRFDLPQQDGQVTQ